MVEMATLLIGVAAVVMVLLLSPLHGLVVYIAVLAWYPSFLSVRIGTIDLTVARMVMLAFFVKLFLHGGLTKQFRFEKIDKLIIVYFAAQILAGATTSDSLAQFLENRAGAAFEMLLPYFAVRLVIQNKQQYLSLLKAILVIAVPLAAVGLWQCLTGENPFAFLWRYYAWASDMSFTPMHRSGFFRANVVFPHPIMYGLFFAMFGPVCMGLLRQPRQERWIYYAGSAVMGVGVFASMSSGPAFALILAMSFILFYRYRKLWRLAVGAMVAMCLMVEVASNRHFYDVIGRFTFNASTAWYRSRLFEVAFLEGGMSGHWLTGFGFADPGWGSRIDLQERTDIVNQYVLVLARYGLVGLIPFIAVLIAVFKKLVEALKKSVSQEDRWLVWCVLAAFFGLLGSFFSVSLFGQPTVVFYMIMGFSAIMPRLVGKKAVRRRERTMAAESRSMLLDESGLIREHL
jgi:uncharacterized membrane protein YuzA (DUF378 family)